MGRAGFLIPMVLLLLAPQAAVRMENRKTGEQSTVPVSSICCDLSYSESLPHGRLEAISLVKPGMVVRRR